MSTATFVFRDPAQVRWRRESSRLWFGLAIATVLHGALLAGAFFNRSSVIRVMGEREGRPDTLSVDIVDAAQLDVREDGDSGARAATSQQSSTPLAKLEHAGPPAPEEHASTASPPAKQVFEPLLVPGSAVQQGSAAAKNKLDQRLARPMVDFAMPDVQTTASDRSTGVTRPSGITRSGENDEFGRGVIRALRRTMPMLDAAVGRITVRIFVTDKGNLQDVQIIHPSGNPILDQNVTFAVRQSSFPLPPSGATSADRTFLVTYVYR